MLAAAPARAAEERIKDLADIAGVRTNQLIGYGLVMGLDGTGDQTTQAPFTAQSLRNMLIETAASGSPQVGQPGSNGLGGTIGGALEASNVNTVEELVNMIETQRAYEINSKAISTVDHMLEYANANLGR